MAKGTGLGLTLVKHIIETVHDGKLSVTSEEGQGSTFTFELPLLN
jgi:two-component system phosphate regulon sensor histidine kinase PhoR